MTDERRVIPLADATALAEAGCLRFRFRRSGVAEEGFVLRHGGRLVAYRNLCPHAESSLDMGSGEFLDETGRLLRCRLHGALFRPGDGVCVEGPCAGQRLEAFPVEQEGSAAAVRLAPGDRSD